ncbi:hypothetical protein C8J56DRAFT_386169 [Mycena floridula]|nr:hypothetical protein C8J56DRAFT_386169 [Mycena floridula]
MAEPSLICSRCGHKDVVEEYKSPLPSHLLETNDPPLASEEQFLREMLEKADFEREIADLDAKLADFEKMTVALRRRREKTVESFVAAKGVLTPIRRVPAEIVGEIILLALTDSITGSIKGTSLDVKEGPWVYSQVCRLWRKEILSRSFIWSNIDILHSTNAQEKNQYSAAVLQKIFQRSHSRPLRLCLRLRMDSSAAKQILIEAVKESKRWKDVRLHLTTKLASGLKQLKDKIPLLEVLHFQCIAIRSLVDAKKHISQCFRLAPALRRLAFQGFHSVQCLNLPWAQLTHFHNRGGENDFLDLFPKVTNVISLAISSSDQSQFQQFQLNNLRTLNITDCQLLPSCLRLPVLEELQVDAQSLDRISAFIRSSRCHLTHLSIFFAPVTGWGTDLCDDDILETLFRDIPRLVTLEFAAGMFSDDESVDISKVLSDATLLPALRRLIFPNIVFDSSLEPLVHVIQSRRATSAVLEEILFTGPSEEGYNARLNDATLASANLRHIEAIRGTGVKVLMNTAESVTFEVTARP